MPARPPRSTGVTPRWVGCCGSTAGQRAYDVGIPAKSAVSGGLLVTAPGHFGGGFFSPGLDRHGNSVRTINICRDLSSRFGLHAYADPSEGAFGRIDAAGDRPADPSPATRRRGGGAAASA